MAVTLGISAFYHDSAAALVVDGSLVAAAQEERFSRKKHDAGFPGQAVMACLDLAQVELHDIDWVVFYEKPLIKFERIVETFIDQSPTGFSSFRVGLPMWMKDKMLQKSTIAKELAKLNPEIKWNERLLFSDHHLSHAASAFFPSPFKEAAVLTLDGVGEWATAGIFFGTRNHLEIYQELKFPHSLGLLYSAFTAYCGFAVNDGEYKLMGLAPYGEPRYASRIKETLIDIKQDGSFRLNMQYFNYTRGLTMFNKNFENFFGFEAREAGTPLDQHFMDMAASIQAITEEVVEKMATHARAVTGMRHLCLAGGVALNCVANGKLSKKKIFDDIWIQPAAGDAGGAVGAALAVSHMMLGEPRPLEHVSGDEQSLDGMGGSLLGPKYSEDEIRLELDLEQAKYECLSESEIISRVVEALGQGSALGWFQGNMEFGPRALGNRSILADARSPEMQRKLNLKTKFRESFRPFAPVVLREHVQAWFDLDTDSPYMLLVAQVSESQKKPLTPEAAARQGLAMLDVERSTIPAVTHVDGSARVQTVDRQRNPLLHRLLSAFYEATGCPVLVNTSFNVNNEPIVCSPGDAYRCFMSTELDVLVLGNFFLTKETQPQKDPALPV